MPRFFRAAGDSDSESEESEDELMSSEDEAPQRPTTTAQPALASFLRGSSDSSSSDSDEESESGSDDDESDADRPQTRILSAVDKRLREMEGTGVVIENALKINDWVAISNGSCLDFAWKLLSKGVL